MSDLNETVESGEFYLVRGIDSKGAARTERVRAQGAQDAIDQLAQRGFTEIHLKTDDLLRAIPGGGGADRTDLSPRDLVRVKHFSPLGNQLFDVWLAYRSFLGVVALGACVWFVERRMLGRTLGRVDLTLALMIFAPLVAAFRASSGAAGLHKRMQMEYVRGNYTKVLELVARFELVGARRLLPSFIALVGAEWRGKAQARLGQLTEALAGVEALRRFPDIKPAAYWYAKAVVHAAAKEQEKVLECYESAAEADPNNPIGWIGMIDSLAIYLNGPAEARLCLERLRELPMTDQLRRSVTYSEATILFAESRFAQARAKFEECLPDIQRRTAETPVAIGLVAILRGQLAIACARTGDGALATAHFAEAREHLELHRIEPLLSRCRREVIGASAAVIGP